MVHALPLAPGTPHSQKVLTPLFFHFCIVERNIKLPMRVPHNPPTMASNDEYGTLKYAVWRDHFRVEKPYKVMSDLQPGFRKTNIIYEDGPPQVFRDARGHESDFTLDGNGFAFCTHPHDFQDWDSQEAIEQGYLPEVERLLEREIPGATRVKVFDWRVWSRLLSRSHASPGQLR